MQNLAVDIGEKFFGGNPPINNVSDVQKYTSVLVQGAFVVAGIIFVFLIIMAGFTMITSASDQNAEGLAKGRNILIGAVLGFIFVIAAYWIVKLIEVITGVTII